MPPKQNRTVTGPSRALIARIQHLKSLLSGLPNSLPESLPESPYHFYFDAERLDDRGYFGEVSHLIEISFETHKLPQGGPILFRQRGACLAPLISVLKTAVKWMTEDERTSFQSAWLERLINGAIASGAKIPAGVTATKRGAEHLTDDAEESQFNSENAEEDDVNEITIVEKPPPPKKIRRVGTGSLKEKNPFTIAAGPPKRQPTIPLFLSDAAATRAPSQSSGVVTKKTGTLESFAFKPAASAEDIARYWAKARVDTEEKRKIAAEEAKRVEEAKAERAREQNRERQRLFREREKKKKEAAAAAAATAATPTINDVLMDVPGSSSAQADPAISSVAEILRAATSDWKLRRNGTKHGVVKNQVSKRVFWQHPFLWVLIAYAVRVNLWSAEAAAKYLRAKYPSLFDAPSNRIHRGTIHRWIVQGEKRFTANVLARVKAERTLAGSGRVGVLTPHREVVQKIVDTLRGLRLAGCAVNIVIARSIMMAIMTEMKPEILTSRFHCSERFVRSFLESTLDWSTRAATRAAKHIPDNASELCERTFFRLVHAIESEHIPAKLIINYDQTGMYLLPNNSQTFEQRGAKQVSVVAKDEKRAYTLGIATACDGSILPLEQVWGGATNRSLPKATADGFADGKTRGFHFTFAASDKRTSHFSTIKTMKELFKQIFQSYVDSVIAADDDLDEDQKWIVYYDIYPVHTSTELREFLHQQFPNLILIYVPGNCTGLLQPQDVGIQRVAKHKLRQGLMEFLVRAYQSQSAAGIKPEDVKFSSSLPVLRDASVRPCVDLYDWFKTSAGHDLIKQAWAKCIVPEKTYNLSYETLTSRTSRKALREYLKTDRILAEEIKARCGSVNLPLLPNDLPANRQDVPEGDLDADGHGDGISDDADVPVEAVIQHVFSDSEPKASDGDEGTTTLSSNRDEENIWAYNDKGEKWAVAGPPTEEDSSE
ncbi:unnamed protein product [Mycena citricolor]|uniref:DDE-1 domain-containing protein n=1 Tax=Mycena citricolor TaxID=2018698 RepID=A0AAD2HFR5_9AGAR|nr:unnamed protein product [Mycena citricolor]